jgi:ribosome-binding factor A
MAARRGSHRPEQVAETIRQVLAETLAREVRDPRVGRVTLTAVSVTPDLGHARIRVLCGEGEERDRALEGLRSASGFLRARVAKALATRVTPDLTFEPDVGLEHARRMDALLASLRQGDEV